MVTKSAVSVRYDRSSKKLIFLDDVDPPEIEIYYRNATRDRTHDENVASAESQKTISSKFFKLYPLHELKQNEVRSIMSDIQFNWKQSIQ